MTKIILTDDDAALRELLTGCLERAGYRVIPAEHGAQALALYAQHRPALIILDMVMPEKEGSETLRDFAGQFPEARILAISGGGFDAGKTYLLLAKQFGACATLAKPFSPQDLLHGVQQLVSVPAGPAHDKK